jgi:hypothetical protein
MSGHGSSNGKVAPAAFPPPVDSRKEFVKRGLDPEDELIEVGVVIVGGGTAGLACANRLSSRRPRRAAGTTSPARSCARGRSKSCSRR